MEKLMNMDTLELEDMHPIEMMKFSKKELVEAIGQLVLELNHIESKTGYNGNNC